MAGTIILAFDVVNQAYVPNYKGSATSLSAIAFRQAQYAVTIYLVQPTVNFVQGLPTYQAFDASDFDGLRVGFWENSTGTLDDEADNLLALTDQLGWAYNQTDPDNPYWTGTLNLLTQQMADWIGSANTKAAYFAVNLTSGSDLQPVFDQRGGTNITVFSATDGGGGVPIDVTGDIPLIRLPVHFQSGNNVYSLIETSPGHLEFSWLNPS